jgi:hypothetical protein
MDRNPPGRYLWPVSMMVPGGLESDRPRSFANDWSGQKLSDPMGHASTRDARCHRTNRPLPSGLRTGAWRCKPSGRQGQPDGVYCRPSCPYRAARPENVNFFRTCEDAERAGFRPCKRCKPNERAPALRHAAKVADICRNIEAKQDVPSLGDLARQANLSPSHFNRILKVTLPPQFDPS